MHGYVMLLPFLKRERRPERPRLIAILLVRVTLFALLGWYSLKALLLYAVAYMLMLHALRFTDAFQHTYDAFAVLESGDIPDDKVRDCDYEQANTYSNLASVGHPWRTCCCSLPVSQRASRAAIVPFDLPQLHAQLYPLRLCCRSCPCAGLWGYHRDRRVPGCWPMTMACARQQGGRLHRSSRRLLPDRGLMPPVEFLSLARHGAGDRCRYGESAGPSD